LTKKDRAELEGEVAAKDKWRTIYDEYNDEQITLSKEEIELIKRIRQGRFPHVEVRYHPPGEVPGEGSKRCPCWQQVFLVVVEVTGRG
jgi:hypothetical protein